MPKHKAFPEGQISLATQLRYFRKKLGLTQVEMAARLGISHSLYTKLEVDNITTTRKRVEEFAVTLHTTPAFLLKGEGAEHPAGTPEACPRLTDELLHKILAFVMDPENQAAARKLAEASPEKSPEKVMATFLKGMIL